MRFSYIIIDPVATSKLQLSHFLDMYDEIECIAVPQNSMDGLINILKSNPDSIFVNLNHRAGEFFNIAASYGFSEADFMDELKKIQGGGK